MSAPRTGLHATVALRVGGLDLDVEVGAPAGAVTAILGPNGAGKTTLLRAVAGTLPIDRGRIELDGVTFDAPPTTFVPPERRRLGVVHQDYLLFPHLTALDNVAFGPRSTGHSRAEARRRGATMLETVGVANLAGVKPAALSGGQAQRVALARALATDPAALLLDEPLSALDAGTRLDVRRELHRHLEAFAGPTLLVTHDPVDVLALADRVVIMEHGRVTQTGALADVMRRPRSRYVADLIGTNLVRGTSAGTTITTDTGTALTIADALNGPAFATIAPSAVALHRDEPGGSPRNRWRMSVVDLDVVGDRVRVRLAGPVDLTAEITVAATAELALRDGDEVWATVKATEVETYSA